MRIWPNYAVCADNSFSSNDRAGKNAGILPNLNLIRYDNTVCAGDIDATKHQSLKDAHSSDVVELAQLNGVICTEYSIFGLRNIGVNAEPAGQKQTDGIGEVEFLLRVVVFYILQGLQKRRNPKPVATRVHLIYLLRRLVGILLLHDGCESPCVAVADDSPVTIGISDVGRNYRSIISLILMQFLSIFYSATIHKRAVAVQNQDILINIL